MDLDGTLTDGTVTIDSNGVESKRFSYLDRIGIVRAIEKGIHIAIISGSPFPASKVIAENLAKQLGVKHLIMGCSDKAAAVRHFAYLVDVPVGEMAYLGDDDNDVPAMQIVGISACPANAHVSVKAVAKVACTRYGGDGFVREFLDWVCTRSDL